MSTMNNKGEAEASMTVKVIKADGSEHQVESVNLDSSLTEEDFSKVSALMNKHAILKKELKELENEITNILRGMK
jgi:hypothetical protein